MITTVIDAGKPRRHIEAMNDASAAVQTRVPARRLRRAEKILGRLGLTPGDAVNLLLAQIEVERSKGKAAFDPRDLGIGLTFPG